MKNKKILKVFSSVFALSIIVSGCSSSQNSTTNNKEEKSNINFETSVTNEGTPISDGHLNIGILSQSPLVGRYSPIFSIDQADTAIAMSALGKTFSTDENKQLKEDDDRSSVKYHLDREKKEVTLTIRGDLKWNDGTEVTADDIIATYNLMGNPKFVENPTYSQSYENIVGMKEYHEGSTPNIAGITKKDDKTVVIQLSKMAPSIKWGAGLIDSFLNKNQIEEASKDFGKFAEAQLNTKPLSYGPYYIDKEANGESVLLKQNPYFYNKDKMKITEVEYKIVPPAQATNIIKNGDIDLIDTLTASNWEGVKDATNGTILGKTSNYFSYVGFKLGKYDSQAGKNIVDKNAKAADIRVREAFSYAVDFDEINEKLYKGIRYTPSGSGLFPPTYKMNNNPDAKKYKKDVEKAKQLLDEAGLKDTDGDGLREDKNGNKLTFNLAMRDTGVGIDQALADNYIKSWKEVGLDVQLVDGKLLSQQDFISRVQGDDPSIDIFQSAWILANPTTLSDLISENAKLNLTRYFDENIATDLENINSDEAFDATKMGEILNKLDDDYAKALPWLPLSWNNNLTWVNKRVKNLDLNKFGTDGQQLYELELTKEVGEKN